MRDSSLTATSSPGNTAGFKPRAKWTITVQLEADTDGQGPKSVSISESDSWCEHRRPAPELIALAMGRIIAYMMTDLICRDTDDGQIQDAFLNGMCQPYEECAKRGQEWMDKLKLKSNPILKEHLSNFYPCQSVRVSRMLGHLGLVTLGDLIQRTAEQLLECHNFNISSLEQVRVMLASKGLALRGDPEPKAGTRNVKSARA